MGNLLRVSSLKFCIFRKHFAFLRVSRIRLNSKRGLIQGDFRLGVLGLLELRRAFIPQELFNVDIEETLMGAHHCLTREVLILALCRHLQSKLLE